MEQPGLFDSLAPEPDLRRNVASLLVRESVRARRLSLRLLPQTLELVVPRGTKPAQVAAFIREQRGWIERASRELPPPPVPGRTPQSERVELRAIGRSLETSYRPARYGERPRLRERGERLELELPRLDTTLAAPLLRTWLRALAAKHLVPWLARESARTGLAPKAARIRLQRTRWGSCSASGTISLNAALLFLEPAIVRYLLVHELCHLRALDHSPRYWREVARHEPDYRELDRALSAARAQVPAWVYPERPAAGLVLDVL